MDLSPEVLNRLENRILGRNFIVNPNDSEGIQFCVAHIVLKAIALAKDPKPNKDLIREMFNLASEIMALSDVKTDHENQRLKDLINAMIDSEDIAMHVRTMTSEVKGQVKSLEEKLLYQMDMLKEDIGVLGQTTQENNNILGQKSSNRSVFKVGVAILFFIAVILFTFIGGAVIMVSYYNSLSQPQSMSKSSMLLPPSYTTQHDAFYSISPVRPPKPAPEP